MSTMSNTLISPFGHVVSSIERKLGVKLTRRCQVSISPYYIMGAFLLSTSHHTWPLFLEQSQPALIHCHRSVKSQWVLLEVDTHHWATEMSFVGCLYFLNFFFTLSFDANPWLSSTWKIVSICMSANGMVVGESIICIVISRFQFLYPLNYVIYRLQFIIIIFPLKLLPHAFTIIVVNFIFFSACVRRARVF